jgi:CoA:oxalate CoA-transferase
LQRPAHRRPGIVLDIKSPRDGELLERLLDKVDVVVENFRPGVLSRLGYDADRLAKTHLHIVYASISGFVHTEPFSDLPVLDRPRAEVSSTIVR